ncbi:RIO-like serine/threonine protein kinase [Clostridium tetanomorphum]|uniref:Protein kinase n=1 Tax=Clostridium tetanomorphum TaxID=1553 RepID=A0A923J369_CLOTT|nr:protein kinase [Clostridium tetanomorphum]KAJ49832.1 serine/threonine kinase [Clostridium tetanomorphum DSM 665]MBC2399730.1 protein kinase [Clostridium tetanomorphum]MBP1865134.1 RIO-like serine/threonine protein kinase [Clostridium tetanomorphum]NRS84727.1 RIO-like serine/threonine protein kinase [Clostridium tetanomorphum]NRZ97943.1 RIO-like serine/threonine protein kinase [Clostridium tetanomorphum]
MPKNTNYFIELDLKAEKMLKKAQFLGKGHNGIVYSLPNKKVIKIFRDKKVCKTEYDILRRIKKSNYFPKTYEHGDYYIVRDYVDGERLDKYIKKNGFNKKIALNIIKLIEEFQRLNFKKLDIRCKDLYIRKDFSIKVIDPKNNFSKEMPYPRHLMKGLNNLGVLDDFLTVVKNEHKAFYKLWNFRINQYLDKGIK